MNTSWCCRKAVLTIRIAIRTRSKSLLIVGKTQRSRSSVAAAAHRLRVGVTSRVYRDNTLMKGDRMYHILNFFGFPPSSMSPEKKDTASDK